RIDIMSGNGTRSGTVRIHSGNTTDKEAGSILIYAGASTFQGGSVELKGGDSAARAGNVTLQPGGGRIGGSIKLTSGDGIIQSGDVFIRSGFSQSQSGVVALS